MNGLSVYRPSVIALVAANLVPLFGALFWRWDAFAIVLLYWAENVIIGGINILKMIFARPAANDLAAAVKAGRSDPADQNTEKLFDWIKRHGGTAEWLHHSSKLLFIPFFTFHYGMFCFVHGLFVFAMFGHEDVLKPHNLLTGFRDTVVDEHLGWALAALAASHLYSFAVNYLGKGEYRHVSVPELMMQPYGRVVVLHIAIIAAGFVVTALGSPVAMLAFLVVGKTIFDVKLHVREHERNAPETCGKPRDEIAAGLTTPVA